MSQSQCGRPPSQAGYASLPWWAVAPPTSFCAIGPSLRYPRKDIWHELHAVLMAMRY